MNAVTHLPNHPHPVKLNVRDFRLLCDAGAFLDYGKAELIEGEILCMNSQLSRHARAKTRLTVLLSVQLEELGSPLEVISEVAVILSDDSMPEPDITVSSYQGDREVPLADAALVIEVSDATVRFDLGRKKRLYARTGVPEYWVVDVTKNMIHQMWNPQGEDFAGKATIPFGSAVTSQNIPGLTVDSSALS